MTEPANGRRVVYLSPKGLASVRARVTAEERTRLDALVKSGDIRIVGAGKSEETPQG